MEMAKEENEKKNSSGKTKKEVVADIFVSIQKQKHKIFLENVLAKNTCFRRFLLLK